MCPFPTEIRKNIGDLEAFDVSCHSNAKTFRYENGLYLKIDGKGELAKENRMARLYESLGLGPKVIEYISADKDYLLTKEVDGKDLTHCLEEPMKLCEILAGALRRLHAIPIEGVPVSSRYERYIESSRGTIEGGYYDPSFLMGERNLTKEEAWTIMQEKKHLLRCDAFIHGDACLPNIIANDGEFKAFVDTGLSGVGDRHIDIYWALWSLEYNLMTNAYNDLFKDLYGRENISEEMLRVVEAFEVFG